MDERRLKATDVCDALHVSEQTIHQWRCLGVPARRLPHVARYMAEWTDPATHSNSQIHAPITDEVISAFVDSGQNLIIHPSEESFEAWSQAALSERKTLKTWAHDGLEQLAALNNSSASVKPPLEALPPAPQQSTRGAQRA